MLLKKHGIDAQWSTDSTATILLKIGVGGGVSSYSTKKHRHGKTLMGIDSVNAFEHPHLAWIASNANSGLLENPASDTPSVQIIFPDNSTDKVNLSLFTGYHLTQGALIVLESTSISKTVHLVTS